jgi:hypothetical protein
MGHKPPTYPFRLAQTDDRSPGFSVGTNNACTEHQLTQHQRGNIMTVSVRKTRGIALALTMAVSAAYFTTASAANWFKIQDTNPKKVPLISGFIEPDVFAMAGTPAQIYNPVLKRYISAIPHDNLVGPNFSQSTTGIIQRARLMIRGWINPHISYFFAG